MGPKQWLEREARALGFSAVGVSKARRLDEEASRLEDWLKRDYAGEMNYLERNFEKRLDPRLLVPGTKSVVSLVFNYHNPDVPAEQGTPRIASYALGSDYHFVLKWKLKELLKRMRAEWGAIEGRVFVDSAPVLERAWAAASGLGWVGKNSLLITKGVGSFYFLAEMMLDIELEPDGPVKDHCGSCTRCLDVCPTGAIIQPGVVDGSRCISYYTIELKGAMPVEVKGKLADWMFGCDVCQSVCPWNSHAERHTEPKFEPDERILKFTRKDWTDLTEEVFHEIFKGTPVKRTGYAGLKRNVEALRPIPD